VPAYVLVGIERPGNRVYPFTPKKPDASDSSIVTIRNVVMGDFCLSDKEGPGGHCTTGLLTLDEKGIPKETPNPLLSQIKAFVQAADGTSLPAAVKSIGPDSVRIEFTAPSLFKPAWLVLETSNGAHTFAYAPAQPVRDIDLVYTSDDLGTICKLVDNKPSCTTTAMADLEPLKPVASNNASATFVAAQGKLLFARVRAPMGLEPTAILVTNIARKTSVIVRRTIKPAQNTNLLQVDLTPVDQDTVQRNYGNRIAKRYLAYTLDVKNPTAKRLQFRKSAVYFDVDYIEAKGPLWVRQFREVVKSGATMGMIAPNPYVLPFSPKRRKGESKPLEFRFNLEQNLKHSPLNYLSVLGTYDETTEKTQSDFDTVQLLASIVNTIATGGIAGTGQFQVASSLLSGVFLPGLKGIVLNDSRINRHRTNLVTQTLQDVIEVPPGAPISTIVLLPRTGLLAFSDAEIPVMVKKVIDVHLVTEVVTEITASAVQKGACKVGYTKDQARDALGEPAGATTNSDASSIFTFTKGPVVSASFDAGGLLVSCAPRSNTDQLAQATTLVEMNTTLTNLSLTSKRINLTDDSVVLVDIPGVQQTYHFDNKGNKTTDYTFLFAKIKTFETQTKDALDTFLQLPTTALSAARTGAIQATIKTINQKKTFSPNEILTYNSPDIQDGAISVTLDADGKKIAKIAFVGYSPTGVN